MRYLIGIDLGTTNCALSFIDTEQPSLPIQLFTIPQLTASGKIDSLSTLPSFCYISAEGEWPSGALKLPWKREASIFVGQLAKSHGAKVPTRVVQSAKSWLCNVAANRRDKILPIDAADLNSRLSPVEASARYLLHLKEAWNASMAKGDHSLEMEEQEVIITVPASFDEVARELTFEAARQAGFQHINLVEEPQAAFYSWISQHEKNWESMFNVGDMILVCDVGGGTTDFSLIEIQSGGDGMCFQRMAVGDHLLLGGDNMDAALAHFLEQKMQSKGVPPLDSAQWLQLQAEARRVKETLLENENGTETSTCIVLHGTGSSVVKGSLAVEATRQEFETLLLDGFFGQYPLEEALTLKASRGFRTMGLPFEDEPSITKQLAYFLKQARILDKGVNYILFNGGTLKPEIFRKAIENSLKNWFPNTSLERLSSGSLDLAVARGAAYYGKARRGLGISIRGGLPRSYYLKIDIRSPAGSMETKGLTLLSRGSQEGKEYRPEQVFSLRSNTPISFHLLTSHVRLNDKEGDLVEIDPLEMQSLPPIQTILRYGKKQVQDKGDELLPVLLAIRLTPIGTIELWLESKKSDHQWSLEFQLQTAEGHEPMIKPSANLPQDETLSSGALEGACRSIEALFDFGSDHKPGSVMERLEAEIGKPRREWSPSILRELWTSLLKGSAGRKKSMEHEARWWNLAGFFLRPGFGHPMDDFRIKELWKIILADLNNSKPGEGLIQMWICFRRISGGLSKGQQIQLAASLLGADLPDKKSGKIEIKRKSDLYPYSERIRALASLERLELSYKIRLGEALVARIVHGSAANHDYWSLGRIGARHLLYGSAGQVVPKDVCGKWVEKLLNFQPKTDHFEAMIFLFKQLARKTDQRELNLSPSIIQKILEDYPDDHLKEWLLEEKVISQGEQEQMFGDQLPSGIILEVEKL